MRRSLRPHRANGLTLTVCDAFRVVDTPGTMSRLSYPTHGRVRRPLDVKQDACDESPWFSRANVPWTSGSSRQVITFIRGARGASANVRDGVGRAGGMV